MDEPSGSQSPGTRKPGYQMDFFMGQAALMQFETGGQKYRTTVVGMEAYEYVILRLPIVPGVAAKIKPDMKITLYLEHEGTLYGFSTSVVQAMLKPSPLLMVAYPYSVERLQLRRYKRTPCFLPGLLVSPFHFCAGLVTDISAGGCRMIMESTGKGSIVNIMTGDEVELRLPLEGLSVETFPAKVLNQREVLRNHYSVGIFFDFTQPSHKDMILNFIKRLTSAANALAQEHVIRGA